ncbi:MAG: hypothetical protein KA004_07990 [Verrucomicrobiales bacterium]|nr:hypothetical protein [Verrucomicrobiales bacterium]
MFRQLIPETWSGLVPILSLALTLGIFLYFIVRAIVMKRPEADRLARLPLDNDSETQSTDSLRHE